MDDSQPIQFVERLAIHNTSVNLHRRDTQQVFDEELEEDQVQKAGRRRHWPLTNSTLDDFSVKSMSNHRGAGHLFELGRTAGVVLMRVSQEDVPDLGRSDPGLLQSVKDLVTMLFQTSIDESVAGCGAQKKTVDDSQIQGPYGRSNCLETQILFSPQRAFRKRPRNAARSLTTASLPAPGTDAAAAVRWLTIPPASESVIRSGR